VANVPLFVVFHREPERCGLHGGGALCVRKRVEARVCMHEGFGVDYEKIFEQRRQGCARKAKVSHVSLYVLPP